MILLSEQNFLHMKSLFNHPIHMLEPLTLWLKEFEISTETCLENLNSCILLPEPWFDMYLKSRLPIVLNYNPFISFQDDPRPEYQNQV